MTLKKKDFQRLVNFIKDFQKKLPCSESSAELRDSLNLSLLLTHKYYKKARFRCYANGANTLESSLNLSTSLTGAASPLSPYVPQADKFDWRWLSLDVGKLSASFGHGDKANFVPEVFFVIKDCDLDQLKEMVDEDEDKVNELDAIGRTTAMYATNGGTADYLDCLTYLIDKGVDLQHHSTDGFTCLHIACFFGYKEFIAILLEAKVDVNAQDSDGRSPLHFAAAYCSHDILEMLLVNGANPKSQDSEGLTPAMWACHFDQIENLQILLATEEKLNPSPEARFEVVDNLGRTILHWAVTKTNNINCMRYLLNAETAQLCDDEGKTIFLIAAEHGCISACEEIFNLCSEDVLEELDNFGRTALHLATLGGHGEVVEFLLNKGAMADRPDCQGVSPLHLVTSRKLNYCNLVFTSYQRYRERLACVQGSLGGVVDEKNDDEKLQEDEKNMVEQVEDLDEGYGIERVESKDKRNLDKGDEASLKIDCQDAVGFEIEGDIEEDAEFDVLEGEEVDEIEIGGSPVLKEDSSNNEIKETSKSKVEDEEEEGQKGEDQKEEEQKEEYQKENHMEEKENKIKGATIEAKEVVAEDGGIILADIAPDQVEENDGNKDETKKVGEQVVDESDFEVKDVPPEELEVEEESEGDDYDFENISIGGGDQKIVLIAHHEGGDKFEVDFGNDVNDLEFQYDNDDEEDMVNRDEIIGENDFPRSSDFNDGLKGGFDRDLSPKIESVTRLMETNTAAANQSVSMNMSVSSLRSDSEDDEAMPSGREKTSKLDSKIPVFDNHYVNQLEYRDPFAKGKPFLNLNESDSVLKKNDDSRPKTSHGKRKEKKDNQKNRQLSPKSKQQQGGQHSPRLHLGALEPMKPLQPIIPPQGIQGPRGIGGSHNTFSGMEYDSMKPSSPRSPLERSNALSSPGDSPRSKKNPLSSPRGAFESRDGKLSHIPRPSSPSSRERHLPVPNNNIFAPRPPLGR